MASFVNCQDFFLHIWKFSFCPWTNQMPLVPTAMQKAPCIVYFSSQKQPRLLCIRVDQTSPRHRPATRLRTAHQTRSQPARPSGQLPSMQLPPSYRAFYFFLTRDLANPTSLKMAAKYIILSTFRSFVIAYAFDQLVSDKKIFGGTTPRTVSNKEWWEETDKKFQAWPRTAGPPVVMNPISR